MNGRGGGVVFAPRWPAAAAVAAVSAANSEARRRAPEIITISAPLLVPVWSAGGQTQERAAERFLTRSVASAVVVLVKEETQQVMQSATMMRGRVKEPRRAVHSF